MVIHRYIILFLLTLLCLSGCGSTPVRHLASDAVLIASGKTTKADVLLLLGEPETRQLVSEGVEKWIYYEEEPSFLQETPLVGDMIFDAKGFRMIEVEIKGNMVTACSYSEFSDADYKWADDFAWQEKKL